MTKYIEDIDGTSCRINYHKNLGLCTITVYGRIPRDVFTYVDGAEYMNWANDICIRLRGEGKEKEERLKEFVSFVQEHHKDAEVLIREYGRNMGAGGIRHQWKEWEEWTWD